MKYNKEERKEIGRRIYEGEISTAIAAESYGINIYTARDYLRLYKAYINVSKCKEKCVAYDISSKKLVMDEYKNMTREELIDELIKSKINE